MIECNMDYFGIISGNPSLYSRAYKEAVEDTEKRTPKGMAKLKAFLEDISRISKLEAVKDDRITSSRGNLENFSAYDSIKSSIEFLDKNLASVDLLKELKIIRDELLSCSQIYQDAYAQKCGLVVLEYESAVFLLVIGLSLVLSSGIEMKTNGTEIRITKKAIKSNGSVPKMVKDMAKVCESKDHKTYLKGVLRANKMPVQMSEAVEFASITALINTLSSLFTHITTIFRGIPNIFKMLRSTLFCTIPLIRSIMYHHYQKKADKVAELELQAAMLEENISILQNRTNVDPVKKEEIIKKQQAYVEKYRKQAEKIRAEICEMEKDATKEMQKTQDKITNASEDDFVLESIGLKGSE